METLSGVSVSGGTLDRENPTHAENSGQPPPKPFLLLLKASKESSSLGSPCDPKSYPPFPREEIFHFPEPSAST